MSTVDFNLATKNLAASAWVGTLRNRGLIVGLVGSVVPDLRICENDDLTSIGGIGSDFLIAG